MSHSLSPSRFASFRSHARHRINFAFLSLVQLSFGSLDQQLLFTWHASTLMADIRGGSSPVPGILFCSTQNFVSKSLLTREHFRDLGWWSWYIRSSEHLSTSITSHIYQRTGKPQRRMDLQQHVPWHIEPVNVNENSLDFVCVRSSWPLSSPSS